MSQTTAYQGAVALLDRILLEAIIPQHDCSVSQENPSFVTSYDLGPNCMVVPASPPLWSPPELPIDLPIDTPAVDPRTILGACPLDPLLRAIQITAPDLDLNEFDLITNRKNLRALYNFVRSGKKQWGRHRIDAEIVNGTVLFHLGWSGSGYGYHQGYGMNFEKKFTTSLSKGTIQHCRVIEYGLGGLKMMVKYQVDACLDDGCHSSMVTPQAESSAGTTSTGFRITSSGTIVAPHNIVEIKTIPTGYRPDHPRTLTQLWFSRTPILMAGYHDRNGQFSSVEEINVEATGALDQWEEQNTETLQKIIRLLEMVKTQLLSSPIKRQAIVLTNLRSYDCVEFYSLSHDYEMGLPDDLRRKWA